MAQRVLMGFGLFALAFSVATTVVVMIGATGGRVDTETLLIIGWAVSPYVCFLLACKLVERFTSLPHTYLIAFVVPLLMLAFTLFVYVGALNGESSTDGLVFIFAPIYLYFGSFLLLAIGLFVSWISTRKPSGQG